MALLVLSPAPELIAHKRLHLPPKTHGILAAALSSVLWVSTSAAEGFCHSLPKISLVNLNIYVSWFHTSEKKRGNSMIYTFFQQNSASSFPSSSGFTVYVCVLVFVCVCAHVYAFGQSPIKQLMLAVFHHCDMGLCLTVFTLALCNTKTSESYLIREFCVNTPLYENNFLNDLML